MSYCPLKNYEYMGWAQCVGTNCALSDDKGSCLIKQFLQLQVNKEMARLNEENIIAEARKNAANNFIEMLMKNPPTDIRSNINTPDKIDAGWGGF